jgi:subtilase family protein
VLTRYRPAAVAAAAAVCALTLGVLAPGAMAAADGTAVPAGHERLARHGAPHFGQAAGTQLVKDLRAAWQISKGEGVTIALIGSGVDGSAAGLSGKVKRGPAFGHVPNQPAAPDTALASAMAGSGPSSSNPAGTVGLAPAARILDIRINVRERQTHAWQQSLADAIRYAASHRAKVIFVDEIGLEDDLSIDGAVHDALSKGVVVIGAGYVPSRHSPNTATFPNSLPGVIGVASPTVPGMGQLPPHHYASPANDSILVSAPGNVLNVSGPGGSAYGVYNLYSAGAWLTATVAIIKSVYPRLPPAMVARSLALSARDHPRGGYDPRVGFGMINPIGALHEAARLRALRSAAAAGPGVADPSTRFVASPVPGTIHAVRHSVVKLAGFGGAMGAGVLLLVLGVLTWRRRSRQAATPGAPWAPSAPSAAGWAATVPPSGPASPPPWAPPAPSGEPVAPPPWAPPAPPQPPWTLPGA